MKKLGYIFTLILCVSIFSGCHSDIDSNLSNLERKVTNLYDKINNANINSVQLSALFDKLNSYDFVKSVKRDLSYDKETYVISFTHSDPIVLSCGEDGVTPVIGLRYEDGKAYWTVKNGNGDTEFLYNENGERISVNAAVPRIRISDDGKWEVSVDNGKSWKSLGVLAAGKTGTSFVESVDIVDGYLQVKLISGDVITLPTKDSYDALMEDINALNTNIKSISEIVEKMKADYIYVKGSTPIINGADTIGFKLTLSDDSSYSFYHGTSTNKPSVMVQRDTTDSLNYWAIKYHDQENYEWILDEDGNKISVNAVETNYPKFRVSRYEDAGDGVYYWQISWDGGETYDWIYDNTRHALVATPTANDGGITSITYVSGTYYIKVFGESYNIPGKPQWGIKFNGVPADSLTVNMKTSDTVNVAYAITDMTGTPEIASYADGGFKTWVEKTADTDGNITIISPATFTKDSTYVKVIVSDGLSAVKNYKLKVKWQSSAIN